MKDAEGAVALSRLFVFEADEVESSMGSVCASSNHVQRRLAPGWYPLVMERSVSRRPLRRILADQPFVVYRTKNGISVGLDRCPHRNVPLSGGRIVDGELECPYHGWRFDSGGRCTRIPGRIEEPKPSHRMDSFPTSIHQGIVFVGLNVAEGTAPFMLPQQSDRSYRRLVRQVTFPASMFGVVENALDVPHTSILHRGLFRTTKRNRVQVKCRRFDSWMEAEYIGEPPPSGIVGRFLSSGAGQSLKVEHFDRFFLPGVLQVEYRLGHNAHFVITGYLRPINADTTEVFASVCIKTPLWGVLERLLLVLVEPLARLIARQDVRVLRAQTENIRALGGTRFMSTEVDVVYSGLTRLLKEASSMDVAKWVQTRDGAASPREIQEFEMEA